MTEPVYPQRWANDLTLLLNTVLGEDRFPVSVPEVAREFSAQRYPDDAITLVRGDVLRGFDGALARAPAGKKGWGIFYNTAIGSPGRINFTLAHEFGHYLMHRQAYPNGIRCGDQDVVRWDSQYGQLEHRANVFSATLLMPLDDFRRQVSDRCRVDLDVMSGCAERYRVSLIAALLRWLESPREEEPDSPPATPSLAPAPPIRSHWPFLATPRLRAARHGARRRWAARSATGGFLRRYIRV